MVYRVDELTVEQLKELLVLRSHTGEELSYLFEKYGKEHAEVFFELAEKNPKVKEAIIDDFTTYGIGAEEAMPTPEWKKHFPLKEIEARSKKVPQLIKSAFNNGDVDMSVLIYWLYKNESRTKKIVEENKDYAAIAQKYFGGWAKREIFERDEVYWSKSAVEGLYNNDITPQDLLRCIASRPAVCRNILEHDPVARERMRQFVAKEPNFVEAYRSCSDLGGNTLVKVSKLIYEVLNKTATQNKLAEDKKKDIQTLLNLKDLNIYQLEVCLDISPELTGEILRQNKELSDKVYKLFVNPQTYNIQKDIRRTLQAGFDVDEAFKECERNLRALSGDEVFTILTTPIPEADKEKRQDAKQIKKVLDDYYAQTRLLSKRAPDAQLNYDGFADDKRWTEDKNALLEIIGKYADKPSLEKMMEERIGKIFSLYSYHEEKTEFQCLSSAGAEAFQKNMVEELRADPTSDKAKFYVKYADAVLNQNETRIKFMDMLAQLHPVLAEHYPKEYKTMLKHIDNIKNPTEKEREDFNALLFRELNSGQNTPAAQFCVDRIKGIYLGRGSIENYLQMVSKVIPQIADTQPEICNKMSEIMPEIKGGRYYEGDVYKKYMADEILARPESRLSRFYVENFAKVMNLEDQIEVATNIVEEVHDSKDFADRFKAIADSMCRDIAANPEYSELFNNLIKYKRYHNNYVIGCGERDFEKLGYTLYQLNPTPEQTEAITKMAAAIKPDKELFGHYYAGSQATGLDCFDGLMDTVLQTADEACVDIWDKKIPYADLIKRIQQIGDKMTVKDLKIKDMPDQDGTALYKALMAHKPKHLHYIGGVNFKFEQCMELMQKYPDLYLGDGGYYNQPEEKRKEYSKLCGRNHDVYKILDYNSGIESAIKQHLLLEALPAMDEKHYMSMEEMSKPGEVSYYDSELKSHKVEYRSIFELIRRYYDREEYNEVVDTLARFCKDDKLKKEVALWKAIEDGSIAQYLEQMPPKERPTIAQLSQPMPSNPYFSDQDAFWKTLNSVAGKKEDGIMMIKDVLKTLKVTDKEAELLAQKGDNLGEVLGTLDAERKIAQQQKENMNDFMAWMAKNNKDGKGK